MGRKSSITQLDSRIREAVDAAIREGRATTDELVDLIQQHGGKASRSAVGRYVKNAKQQMAKFRQAKEIAKVWVGSIEEDPDGDVGRLITEMLRTVAFQTIGDLGEGGTENPATSQDIFFLGKAIKELASADKISADREIAIRREMAKAIERKVDTAARSGEPLTAERFKAMVKEVYGG